ncbi:hypothetical protein [Pararhodobacter zhoushanensis]|uniref:hypothetical protein n=1 Tax=Pararhodobacter zhoushanensis TaxID=2479545 RepID=UPI000F8D028C|nr:hypothetical protein [Pararhodobacter zhoushanensis]
MSGDPWMPWALMAFGLAMLAWTYWPALRHKFIGGKNLADEGNKGLNQSVNIGTMTGGAVSPVYNNNFNTIVAPGRAELSDDGFEKLVNALSGKTVNVEIVGDDKCQEIGNRLIARLAERGISLGSIFRIGMHFPPPSDPYSIRLTGNGGPAALIISPATLP